MRECFDWEWGGRRLFKAIVGVLCSVDRVGFLGKVEGVWC